MKYYIIAGEASGDLHGSNLIYAIKAAQIDSHFRVFGGDMMEKAGASLATHYSEMSFMGFWEVIKNLPTIKKKMSFCKEDIKNYHPDVIIFIDFSGFNLRIAEWAKKEGYKTAYYIAPQLWASRAGRVEKMKQFIDLTLVILPFEPDFYKKHQHKVHFVGHPLLDAIESTSIPSRTDFLYQNGLDNKPIIALLPGSRKQEVANMLPLMLDATSDFPDYVIVVAKAPSLPEDFYRQVSQNRPLCLVNGQTYPLLAHATAALVTSGTATLETALFEVPQVVCYKGNWISYQIAKRIITLEYISLVNLVMNKMVVKELIQNELNVTSLKKELGQVLNPQKRRLLQKNYQELKRRLGGSGASARAANEIINTFK